MDGIEKGSVVHLSCEADLGAFGIDIALPNVIEHTMWLERIAGN